MLPLRRRLANRWRPWFRAMDALGEDTRIRWGKVSLDGVPLETGFVRHEDYDGVGLFAKLLRENEGFSGSVPMLRQKPPETRRRAEVLTRVLRAPERPSLPWKKLALETKPRGRGVFAFTVLSAEETETLFGRGGRRKMMLSSYLLHALHAAIIPDLVGPTDRNVWLLPVNMRGAVESEREHENHISFLPIGVRDGATAGDVGKAMRDALRADLHWGTWDAMGARALLGETFMRAYTRLLYARLRRQSGTGWLGSFSFGGAFDPPLGTRAKFAWWGVPPTSLMWPISAGAFSWGGRMSFALQLHASLARDSGWVESAVLEWKARALADAQGA